VFFGGAILSRVGMRLFLLGRLDELNFFILIYLFFRAFLFLILVVFLF
jgi:hypothetical protein